MLGGGATDIGSQSAKEEYAKEFEKSTEEILNCVQNDTDPDVILTRELSDFTDVVTAAANDRAIPSPLEGERICGRTNEVSPDSEQIEHTVAKATIAKLCERGTNSRQGCFPVEASLKPRKQGEGFFEQTLTRISKFAPLTKKFNPLLNQARVNKTVTAISRFTFHVSQKKRAKRNAAFTLAEVLITLGIIGVVAAMTMPTLIQNNNEKATVTKLKKFMSVMNSAIQMSVNENGPVESWNIVGSIYDYEANDGVGKTLEVSNQERDKFAKLYLLPYLKYTKFFPFAEDDGSRDYERHSLDGTKFSSYHEYIILGDGTSVNHLWLLNNCSLKVGNTKQLSSVCAEIGLDINGRKAPNQSGVDVFYFYITKYGVIPMGSEQQTSGYTFDDYCNKSKTNNLNGYGCTAWVIYNENMDYLRCSDLSWKGKTKCR